MMVNASQPCTTFTLSPPPTGDVYQVRDVDGRPRIVRLAKWPEVVYLPGGTYPIPRDELRHYGYGETPESAREAMVYSADMAWAAARRDFLIADESQ